MNFFSKLLVLIVIIYLSTFNMNGQKGLFVKFSLGHGYTIENSKIIKSGFSIATKNHAIGWGIHEKCAIQIGDFGRLNKYEGKDYKYINLDVFGLGVSYQTPIDLKVSVMVGYSVVSLAKDWSGTMGKNDGHGFGINISLDKEWFIVERWGLRVGPQLFLLKTTDTKYNFLNASINGSIVFYLNHYK